MSDPRRLLLVTAILSYPKETHRRHAGEGGGLLVGAIRGQGYEILVDDPATDMTDAR